MKRIIRNTLLSDFVGAAFCLIMGIALVLMYTGCSEDKSVAGGASEEPSGLVKFENITVAARAYYVSSGESNGGGNEVSVAVSPNLFAYGGYAHLVELDSVTLALSDTFYTAPICATEPDTMTGQMLPCDGTGEGAGLVRFENLALNSPIVMLEAISGTVTLRAVLDVRDSGSIAIDGLSHLVYERVKNLVGSGMSFASAKSQAETEITNAFVFDESAVMRQRALSEGISYTLLEKVGEEFGAAGSFAGLSDSTKRALEESIEGLRVFTILEFPSIAFERLGDSSALYYQECLQMKSYYANLLASVFGHGTCSAEKEGMIADVSGYLFELKCVDGSWDIVRRGMNDMIVNHTFGTMTDSRDGKTYKTVTIDMDGTSQTWMAENLKYEAEGSECYREKTFKGARSYCAYGRLYSFLSMLDSIYFKYTSEEGCVAVKTEEYLAASLTAEENPDTSSLIESAREGAREECSFLFEEDDYSEDPENVKWDLIADSLDVLDFNMCPDGWHVARYEDWDELFSFLRNRFGVKPGEEINLLRSSYGDPTGFGMDLVGDIRGTYGSYKIVTRMFNYLFEPTLLPEKSRNPECEYAVETEVFGSIMFPWIKIDRVMAHRYYTLVHAYGSAGGGFVRCVKD